MFFLCFFVEIAGERHRTVMALMFDETEAMSLILPPVC